MLLTVSKLLGAAVTRLWRLFTKNTGLCEFEKKTYRV